MFSDFIRSFVWRLVEGVVEDSSGKALTYSNWLIIKTLAQVSGKVTHLDHLKNKQTKTVFSLFSHLLDGYRNL